MQVEVHHLEVSRAVLASQGFQGTLWFLDSESERLRLELRRLVLVVEVIGFFSLQAKEYGLDFLPRLVHAAKF